MYELRWNPFLKWWVIESSESQKKPLIPEDYYPFCLVSDKVPNDYEVLSYDNDWTVLKPNPLEISSDFLSTIYKTAKSFGKCEVILYSPVHNSSLGEISLLQVEKLMDLWVERYNFILLYVIQKLRNLTLVQRQSLGPMGIQHHLRRKLKN